MKKILVIIFTIVLSLNSIFPGLSKISAADSNKGITIYPAVVELSVGEEYDLNIANNSDQVETIKILPEIFSINSEKENIEPLPDKLKETIEIDLSQKINLEKDSITLNPGENQIVNIKYTEELNNYILGVRIEKESDRKGNVAVAFNLASIILDLDLSEEDLEKINQNVEIESSIHIGNFYFGNEFKIKYNLTNNSKKILKAFGEVTVKDGNTRLEQYSLTTDLQKTIYPSKSVSVEKTFIDSRSFSQRIGSINYISDITINNREIEFTKSIYILPIEFLIVLVLLLPSVILIIFLFKKRSRLLKSSVNKQKKGRRLGQRKK